MQCKTLYCQIFELLLFSFSQVALYFYYLENTFSAKQVNCRQNKLFFAHIELYFYSNKVIENLVFCLMEQFGLIESDCIILGVTKSYFNTNSALTILLKSFAAVGHKHLSSSKVGRNRKSLRTNPCTKLGFYLFMQFTFLRYYVMLLF